MVNGSSKASSEVSMRVGQGIIAAIVATLMLFSVPVDALDQGARAPEIGLRDTDGNMVRLGSLRNKVVLVDFWASWCEPCREELPILNRLYDRYKDRGLVIVGVNIDREESNMRRFLRRVSVDFPVVHDGRHQVADRYSPPRMPSSYLIDQRGVVRYVHAGFRASDASHIEQEIRRLLR